MKGALVVVAGVVLATLEGADGTAGYGPMERPERQLERRLAQHAKALRRNLARPEVAGLNEALRDASVRVTETIEIAPLLGIALTVRDLECDGLSAGALDASSSPGQMSLSVQDVTLSCRASVGLRTLLGRTNTVDIAFGTTDQGLSLAIGARGEPGQDGSHGVRVAEGSCAIDINPSVQLLRSEDDNFFVGLVLGPFNTIVGFLTGVAEGIINQIACAVVEGVGAIQVVPAVASEVTGRSAFLADASRVREESKPEWFDFSAHEQRTIRASQRFAAAAARIGDEGAESTLIEFGGSAFFKQVSDFVNEFLGTRGTGPDRNRITVNQATEKIAMALGDPSGATIVLDSLVAELPEVGLAGGALRIDLEALSFSGLNTFTVLDVARPDLQAKTTLNNKLALSAFGVDVALRLTVDPSGGPLTIPVPEALVPEASADDDGGGGWLPWDRQPQEDQDSEANQPRPEIQLAGLGSIQDNIRLRLRLEDLSIDAALLLAIDAKAAGRVPIGGLVSDNIVAGLRCGSTALFAAELPTLGVSVRLPGQLLDLRSERAPGLAVFASGLLNGLSAVLQGVDVGVLVSGLAQQTVNGVLGSLTTDLPVEEACRFEAPRERPDAREEPSSFGDLLPVSPDFLLNDFFGPSGDLGFNRMAQIVTEQTSGQNGVLQLQGLGLSGTMRDLGLLSPAVFDLRVDLSVSNLSSVAEDTVLLRSAGGTSLQNLVRLTGPMRFAANVNLEVGPELFEDGQASRNEFLAEIDIGTIGASTTAVLSVQVTPEFLATPIGEFSSSPCPLQNVEQFSILEFGLTDFLDQVDLKLRCSGSCTTVAIDEVGALLDDPAVKEEVNRFIKERAGPFLEIVASDKATWALFQTKVLEGPLGNCDYGAAAAESRRTIAIATGVGGGLLALLSLGCCGYAARRRWRASSSAEAQGPSLAASAPEYVPAVLLLGVSAVMLFVLGVIYTLSASIGIELLFSDGSTTKLVLPIGGGSSSEGGSNQTLGSPLGLQPSSLLDAIVDGQALLLALVLGFCTAALPFMWVLPTMAAWLAPTSLMSSKARGRLIRTLGASGKFTLLFPMVLFLLTPLVRFGGRLEAQDGRALLGVDVYLTSSAGVALFCLGVLLAFALSRISLAAHRRALEHGREDEHAEKTKAGQGQPPSPDREAVRDHSFCRAERLVRFSALARAAVPLAAAAGAGLIIAGAALKSHEVTIGGVARLFFDGSFDNKFNLATMIAAVNPTLAMNTDGLFAVILTVLASTALMLVVFIAPLAVCAALAALWIAPITARRQARLFAWAHAAHSIAALDVYVLAILLLAMQLNTTLLQAFVEATPAAVVCGVDASGQAPVARAAATGGLVPGATRCIELTITPLAGTGLLAAAALLEALLWYSVARAAAAAIAERGVSVAALYNPLGLPGQTAGQLSRALACLSRPSSGTTMSLAEPTT